MTTFRHVLRTHRSAAGSLKGHRARHNQIFSYEQTKNGFPYFYCKRKVLADGINTVPLDIEPCPIRKEREEENKAHSQMSDDYMEDQTLIRWMENQFESNEEML